MDEVNIINNIAEIVYKTCGIVFKESNISVLKSRLDAKIKEKKLPIDKYYELLTTDKNELNSFVDFVTTNFTSFFRNERQFEMYENEILPEIIKNSDKKIKIWSAGCSTGEEPYTIAMVTYEYMEKNGFFNKGFDFEIVASDISLESLFIAKEGKYSGKSVTKVSNIYLQKYFDSVSNDIFIIKDFLKKKIKFDLHNLIYDNGIRDIDCVFCRNVIIYFDEDVQRKVLENFYISTKKNAYLLLGHSESLFGIYEKFKPVTLNNGVAYVKD
ncbi:MAG: hypothetical protein N2258_07085 [Brevinematales bacterium]|nr:hypothetical protein [Brevinematales bacterium]